MPQFRLISSPYQSIYILPYITYNSGEGCVIPLQNHEVQGAKKQYFSNMFSLSFKLNKVTR